MRGIDKSRGKGGSKLNARCESHLRPNERFLAFLVLCDEFAAEGPIHGKDFNHGLELVACDCGMRCCGLCLHQEERGMWLSIESSPRKEREARAEK